MLPDPIHLQATARHDQLQREAVANRTGRPTVNEPRWHTHRLPQVLRRLAGQAGLASA